jgi:hypothetical protein
VNQEQKLLTKVVTLDVFHPRISWLKTLAPPNIDLYMMNEATEWMSVMEEKEINCTDHSNVHMMVKL